MSLICRRSCLSLQCYRCSASLSSVGEKRSNFSGIGQVPPRQRRPRNPSNTFGLLSSFGSSLPPFKFHSRIAVESRDSDWDRSNKEDYDVHTSGLRKFELKQEKTLAIISEPLSWSKAQKKKAEKKREALEEFDELCGVDRSQAKVAIRCARKEYNHFEGMRYPTTDIPLVSQYWDKNKYKNDWFVIEPTKKNPSFDANDRFCWEQFVDTLNFEIVQNAISMGFVKPTAVQAHTFLAFSNQKHLYVAAETGCGKTAAFGIPLLSQLLSQHSSGVNWQALILVPSKELLIQTKRAMKLLSAGTGIRIYAENDEQDVLPSTSRTNDWDVLVSTPGTACELLRGKETGLIKTVVIDEADMLLDDSFVNALSDIFAIVKIRASETNPDGHDGARVVFSSASCPDELQEIVNTVVDNRELHYVKTSSLHGLLHHVQQKFIRVREMDKVSLLMEIIERPKRKGQILVFCKDKKTLHFLSSTLTARGISNVVLGGGENREQNFCSVVENTEGVILATDLASRGLDFPNLSHVVNYNFPRYMVDYIHRAGRVGRVASRFGSRVTSFVRCPWEVSLVNSLELAARFNRPIENIETNIPGLLKERREERQDECD